MRIFVDVMGGDYVFKVVIDGVIKGIEVFDDFYIIFVGDKIMIELYLIIILDCIMVLYVDEVIEFMDELVCVV